MEKKRVIAGVVIGGLALAAFFLPGHTRLQELKAEREQYEKRITLLEEYNCALQEEVARMSGDLDYIEKKARDKLGIVRKGEIVYRKDE